MLWYRFLQLSVLIVVFPTSAAVGANCDQFGDRGKTGCTIGDECIADRLALCLMKNSIKQHVLYGATRCTAPDVQPLTQ